MKRIKIILIAMIPLMIGIQVHAQKNTYIIEDAQIKIGVDQQGCIVHLENKTGNTGNVIDYPANGIFGMVCKRGDNWEDVVFPEKQHYQVTQKGNTITIKIDKITTRDATSNVLIVMTIGLNEGKITFNAEIDNRQQDLTVTDFIYPQIGVIKTLAGGKPDLLWPNQSGVLYSNVGDYLSNMSATRQSPNSISAVYPAGYPGGVSMQWMALIDKDQCLYFSGRDDDFYASTLRVNGSSEQRGSILLSIDRFAFVKPGEKWQNPASILMLYTGSWRKGADEYRTWASSWRKEREQAEWVKNMTGYFLVINKQQYGDEMWSYDKLPQLYEMAKAHGCDVLGLFGWYETGHDNMYPDIDAGQTLGGRKTLTENIRKVQAAGGNVTLYHQGHLMDVNAPFYKETGHRIESKSFWGVPYYEKYNKYHNSDFLKHFTSKTFSTVCPSCPEWHDLMVEKTEFIASFGPNGVLFDQIGGMSPNPCFDDTHPHKNGKPSLSYANGRIQLLGKIHHKAKTIDREFAFFTEHICDVYSQFADCLHGIGVAPGGEGNRTVYEERKTATVINYPELFRYCFPKTVITLRNPFPYIHPRVANYALTFGFRYEMELRYLDDCDYVLEDRTPEWKEYAAKITALRKKYRDVLGHGKFVDEEYIQIKNRKVIAKSFLKDEYLAVVLWNDNKSDQKIDLQVDGFTLIEASTVDKTMKELPDILKSQEVVVAYFKKP